MINGIVVGVISGLVIGCVLAVVIKSKNNSQSLLNDEE